MPAQQIQHLPLDSIERDENQPRTLFDAQKLADLAHDIEQGEVKQPIEVFEIEPGRYRLKTGERRWRGSKLVRKATIPAIIVSQETADPMADFIDQCKENALRQDLTPIEWARVFVRIRDEAGVATHQIPTYLAEHGLRIFSRSAISNHIAMLELPDWAIERINDGRLTPSHAKFLGRAKGAELALDALREDIEEAEELGTVYTTADAENAVYHAFAASYPDLDCASFDVTGCTKCRFRRTIKTDRRDAYFCLSEPCHQQKTAEARHAHEDQLAADRAERERIQAEAHGWEPESDHQEQEDQAPKVKHADAGTKPAEPEPVRDTSGLTYGDDYLPIAHADFDTTECQGCPSNKKTEFYNETCFDPECAKRKQRATSKEAGRLGRVSALLDDWLRGQIKRRLGEVERQQILLWAAIGGPGEKRMSWGGDAYVSSEHQTPKNIRRVAEAMNWSSFAHLLEDRRTKEEQDDPASDPVALAVDLIVDEMAKLPLRQLATYLEIDINAYRADEAYLKTLGTEGLTALLALVVGEHAETMVAQSKTQRAVRDLILADYVEQIGLPDELREDWRKSQEPKQQEMPKPHDMAKHLVDKARALAAAGDERNITTLLDILTEAEERHWAGNVEYWESVDAKARAAIEEVSEETAEQGDE